MLKKATNTTDAAGHLKTIIFFHYFRVTCDGNQMQDYFDLMNSLQICYFLINHAKLIRVSISCLFVIDNSPIDDRTQNESYREKVKFPKCGRPIKEYERK